MTNPTLPHHFIMLELTLELVTAEHQADDTDHEDHQLGNYLENKQNVLDRGVIEIQSEGPDKIT